MKEHIALLLSLMGILNASSASRFYHRGGAWHSMWPSNQHYHARSYTPAAPSLNVNSLLGSLLATAQELSSSAATPPYQIVARENDHLLAIDLPGVSKSDVEISLEGSVLRVVAERRFSRFTSSGGGGVALDSSGSDGSSSSSTVDASASMGGMRQQLQQQEQEDSEGTAEAATEAPAGSVRRYERSFELGKEIDLAGISAAMEDGVLLLTLPKLPEARPLRIEISGGGSSGAGTKASRGMSDEIEVTAEPVAEEPAPKDPEAESATHISISA